MRSRAEPRCCPALYLAWPRFASVAETAKRWGYAEAYIGKLCTTGRVKGTMRVPTFYSALR